MFSQKNLIIFSLVVVLSFPLFKSRAFATPVMLCGLWEGGCCTFCYIGCDVDTGHPDQHCNKGGKLARWEYGGASVCLANGQDPFEAYAYCLTRAIDENVGVCVPHDLSSEPEELNGLDDNCDGIWLDDEQCNGIDDDNDGQVDEDQGSCSLRILMVPFCWTGSQAEFEAKATEQQDFLLQATGLNGCDYRYYFEIVNKSVLNISCPFSPTGQDIDAQPSLYSILNEVRDSGLYNTADFDVIEALTDRDFNGTVAGATTGNGLIWSETSYSGQRIILAHEFGHIIGLDDEYCSTIANGSWACNSPSSPNPLDAALGCDPSLPETNENKCCSIDFRDPDETSFMDDTTPCGGIYARCCLGNTSLDVPPDYHYGGTVFENTEGGRCIMSSVDIITVEDPDPRGWCRHCWNYWNAYGPNCGYMFPGTDRILEAHGYINQNGNIFIKGASETFGRMSSHNPAESDDFEVEIRDGNGNVVRRFGISLTQTFPNLVEGEAHFWVRAPITVSSLGSNYSVVVYQNGVVKSQVTLNGQPPVAIASDVTTECTSPDGAVVVLDGSESFDPDGDTIYFKWEATNLSLSDADTASASGLFPLGSHSVSLTVTDGSGAEDTVVVSVTVKDTTPPTLTCPFDITAEQTNLAGTPVGLGKPTVVDICDTDPLLVNDAPEVFPMGETIVTWTATDCSGNSSSCTQTVTIVDTTPPIIHNVSASPNNLWPPNHKMVPVTITCVCEDICDIAPECRIVSIMCNQPVNGTGDGNTNPDWRIISDLTMELRAERAGSKKDDRIYTITVECTDASGNSTVATVAVIVSHNNSKD
jgi:hypothetical protein